MQIIIVERPVQNKGGLLTELKYESGDQPAVYCLEGSIGVTGLLVLWLSDILKKIKTSRDIQPLTRTLEENGRIYFVTPFSGLYSPYCRSDARGVIFGLTRYINRGHIAHAALEDTAYYAREVLDAMNKDSALPLMHLRGMLICFRTIFSCNFRLIFWVYQLSELNLLKQFLGELDTRLD